jgi:hypothetical protein
MCSWIYSDKFHRNWLCMAILQEGKALKQSFTDRTIISVM